MFEKFLFRSAAALATLMLLMSTAQAVTIDAVTIDTVPVGNAGNAADTRHTHHWGSVGYDYLIGKYEVTAGQYTEFLNAVAARDTYGLYNTKMWSEPTGCKIQRSGSSGNYSYSVYSVIGNMADRPVNYVSWGDAARFANWLHNGQRTGAQDLTTTEDGAYYLNGATSDAALRAVNREADWKWAIPTSSEWYKAAYHDKSAGLADAYFLYPTGTETVPGRNMSETTNPGNNANYQGTPSPIDPPFLWTSLVGEFELSDSPYGTFDQGGNVFEWNDIHRGWNTPIMRGGSFRSDSDRLRAPNRTELPPNYEAGSLGFRVASIPEPGSITLLVCGAVGGLIWWRRRK